VSKRSGGQVPLASGYDQKKMITHNQMRHLFVIQFERMNRVVNIF